MKRAVELTGKSKATLGRYYATDPEYADRFMPISDVVALEQAATFPHVTAALAEAQGMTLTSLEQTGSTTFQDAMVSVTRHFARLIESHLSSPTRQGRSNNETARLLDEISALQRSLVVLKNSLGGSD